MGAWCNALSLTVRVWLLCKRAIHTLSVHSAAMSGAGSVTGTGTLAKGKGLPSLCTACLLMSALCLSDCRLCLTKSVMVIIGTGQ